MPEGVRIDKWLWAARFLKTRAHAAEAVAGGRVKVNGSAAKPAKVLREGDELEVSVGGPRRTVIVRELSDKRGPAPVAATLYEETPESIAARERYVEERRAAPRPVAGAGRPTKRDRRRYEQRRRST